MSELKQEQSRKLKHLLSEVYPSNAFYKAKFDAAGVDPREIQLSEDPKDMLSRLPFTRKQDFQTDQERHPPYGSNLTYSIDRYVRHHQTSGTSGSPVRWLDTAESWSWFVRCWMKIFTCAGATSADRALFPFSFGPFIGFWGGFEAAKELGLFTVPAGGMTTAARLDAVWLHDITLLCCTPTYALHLAEIAQQRGMDLTTSSVRGIVVAGEPGGSVPSTRKRIEDAWGARVFDHSGMTECGAYALELESDPGHLHAIESECIVEVLEPEGDSPVPPGSEGELVLTNLGRLGSPLIRYRTGDSVLWEPSEASGSPDDPSTWGRFRGGILGRIDDLVFVRGNNVYPAAVESVVRRFSEVAEYRVVVLECGGLADLRLELEPYPASASHPENEPDLAKRVQEAIRDSLHFRADVVLVEAGSLPRFELKAKRWVRKSS